jgi:hypothetical protein
MTKPTNIEKQKDLKRLENELHGLMGCASIESKVSGMVLLFFVYFSYSLHLHHLVLLLHTTLHTTVSSTGMTTRVFSNPIT